MVNMLRKKGKKKCGGMSTLNKSFKSILQEEDWRRCVSRSKNLEW
jgi:hypothetical protein